MFKTRLLPIFAAVLIFANPGPARCQEAGVEKSVPQLAGEDYLYAIDFLFFTKLAAGELRFSETEQPNIYRAELIGRTLGIASWLSGDRTQTYTSLMELTSGGALRSIEHTSRIVKRKWGKWQDRSHYYRYDYEARKVFDKKSKEGESRPEKEIDIPAGLQPVDMLTAFYNLRTGVYGPLKRGAQFLVPTYAKGKFTEIEVNLLTIEEQAEYENFPAHGQLVSARVDPEIFETDNGHMLVWFNLEGVPERGIVEDVLGLGDVLGYLDMEDL